MMFTHLCDLYLREKRMQGLKESSLSNYKYTIDSIFISNLPKKIDDITDYELYELLEYVNNKLSKKTVIDKVVLLNDILKFSYQKKYIEKGFVLPIPKKKKIKVEIFKKEEENTLINCLIQKMDYFYFGVLLALKTGLRIGELSALQKKDIQFDRVTVNETLQRIKNFDPKIKSKTTIYIGSPKSESSIRDIPIIDDDLIMIFNNLYKDIDDNAYILTGTCNYIEPRTIERKYEKILKDCNINHKNFHVLRHTFATNCIRDGIDINIVSKILGHSSVYVTCDIYIHVDFNMLKSGMKKAYMT